MITDRQIAIASRSMIEAEATRLFAKYRGSAGLQAMYRAKEPGDFYDQVSDRIVQLERDAIAARPARPARPAAPAGIGHNGGEPLEPVPVLSSNAACSKCVHWRAPDEVMSRAYEHWKATGRGQRLKEPTGACDRMRLSPHGTVAFSATKANARCFNFEQKPEAPASAARIAGGYVTIYENGRVIWQGTEGTEPAQYRQGDLL